MKDRIFFENNPWPEGHTINEFKWTARLKDGYVWFDMHLETDEYYAERDIEDDEENEPESDWEAAGTWSNYHACRLSSNFWHEGGFKVCPADDYSADFLDGLELSIDPNPEDCEDFEDLAFHIYLLGHDAVGHHKIKFERIDDSDNFKIKWDGKIALAYIGEDTFEHPFKLTITSATMPKAL